MLYTRIIGNLDVDSPLRIQSGDADTVDVCWQELHQRALRKVSRTGRPVRILLSNQDRLRHGDILGDESGSGPPVVVRLTPAEILVARVSNPGAMGIVALELGNLHVPVEILGEELLIAPDGPAEGVLATHGIPAKRQVRQFHPRRCAGMPEILVSPRLRIVERT